MSDWISFVTSIYVCIISFSLGTYCCILNERAWCEKDEINGNNEDQSCVARLAESVGVLYCHILRWSTSASVDHCCWSYPPTTRRCGVVPVPRSHLPSKVIGIGGGRRREGPTGVGVGELLVHEPSSSTYLHFTSPIESL